MDANLIAKANFQRHLVQNAYPGRGLVVGIDEQKRNLVLIYWIMGRSDDSRNRVFASEGNRVFTAAIDVSKVKAPELTLYTAMDATRGFYAVSNGKQTDAILQAIVEDRHNLPFMHKIVEVLHGWNYEPDPNSTPRISAVCSISPAMSSPYAVLSILKKSPTSSLCTRAFYMYESLEAGFGYCLTTYEKDASPLPSFSGEPLLMPLTGSTGDIADAYWNGLDDTNKVSLAVKGIPLDTSGVVETVIRNKYTKP